MNFIAGQTSDTAVVQVSKRYLCVKPYLRETVSWSFGNWRLNKLSICEQININVGFNLVNYCGDTEYVGLCMKKSEGMEKIILPCAAAESSQWDKVHFVIKMNATAGAVSTKLRYCFLTLTFLLPVGRFLFFFRKAAHLLLEPGSNCSALLALLFLILTCDHKIFVIQWCLN